MTEVTAWIYPVLCLWVGCKILTHYYLVRMTEQLSGVVVQKLARNSQGVSLGDFLLAPACDRPGKNPSKYTATAEN